MAWGLAWSLARGGVATRGRNGSARWSGFRARDAVAGFVTRTRDFDKVAAVETVLLLVVDDNGAVSEERSNSLQGRSEHVFVDGLEPFTTIDTGNFSVLAAEISNLAGSWGRGVARRILATDKWVKMGKCFSAVAALRNWVDVNVVGYVVLAKRYLI